MAVASAASVHRLAGYRAEFPVFERKIYLNSCSLGALSKRSRGRVETFLDTWNRRGAAAWYDEWWDALAELRGAYAAVIAAEPGEIALHASISTALSVIASALDHRRRPKVVTTSLDFPTVAYQWLAKSPHVEVEIVESPDGVTVPVDLIARAVDERTALVATSHVYFTTGAIQDIAAVADAAHRVGALCLIDAYQSAGQLPFAVHDTNVDFLCAGGLKWLLGGPGIAFLYVRSDLIATVVPTVTGWFAHARQFDFDVQHLERATDARRYELGTPALAAVHAQLGGLEIIREIGVAEIHAVVERLTEDLIARAIEAGLALTVAPRPDRSAIVMIRHREPAVAVRSLAEANVVVDARPGHVRLSPFFYNVPEDHVAAIEALRSS